MVSFGSESTAEGDLNTADGLVAAKADGLVVTTANEPVETGKLAATDERRTIFVGGLIIRLSLRVAAIISLQS